VLPLTFFEASKAKIRGSVRGARNQPFSFSPVQAISFGQNSILAACLRPEPDVRLVGIV
jgi:hypothetical protein